MRLLCTVLLLVVVIVSPAKAARRQILKAVPAVNKVQKAIPAVAAHYQVQKVADGIYAALAAPGGKAGSNAMFFVAGQRVVIAGAHFSKEGIAELLAEVAKNTHLPVKYVIITHHHRGYSYIDFDFPPGVEIITSWQSWQALRSEHRELKNPVLFFETSMHLQSEKQSVILTNADRGHAEGNLVVLFPAEGILFTSDLVYNNVIGYMGDGSMREWVMALDVFDSMDIRTVIPGLGKVTDLAGVRHFKLFMKDFLSEVIAHIDQRHDLARTKQLFRLPAYEAWPGYRDYLNINLERAYKDLKE